MRILKVLLIILFALLLRRNANATEIVGGSLRYEALGNQQYKIIGVVNRNCKDSALSIPIFKIYSGTTLFILTAVRTSIKDITRHCSKTTPPCNPTNMITSEGQEQHVFEAEVDFSAAPYNIFYSSGKCSVLFSMEASYRSSKTMNITANNFYLEAMLNLCALGNASTNTNSSSIPQSYADVCANLPFIYNYSFSDKENDSVGHNIEIPKKTKDSFERFIGQFSTQFPMSSFCLPYGTINCTPLPNAKPPRGFYFDNHTGDFILTPTVINEQAIINIRTSEYRKINNIITLIGYSTTEIFLNVKACADNNPPTIQTTNKWNICEGDKLCFTIQSNDTKTTTQTIDDTTTLTWNIGIPGATFRILDPTAREKQAEFCWQTQLGDAKPNAYQFTVYATDDNCPVPGMIAKGFVVTVKPKTKAIRQYRKLASNKIIFYAEMPDSYNYTYDWLIKDTISNPPIYRTYKQKDSFTFKDTGLYFITLTANNAPYNCPITYTDTIRMNGTTTNGISNQSVSKLRIYPNPTNGLIKIELDKDKTWTTMKLMNNLGQVVYSGPTSLTFDMSKYEAGFYFIEFLNSDMKYIQTVIKQ